jgi:hypothetical protein
MGVKYLSPWDDNLPYVRICCLSFSSQELVIVVSTGMEVTEPHTANWTCGWLQTSGTLWTNLPTVNNLVPRDFHDFGPFASPKQAVTCQQTPDTNCFWVKIQHFGPHLTNLKNQHWIHGGLFQKIPTRWHFLQYFYYFLWDALHVSGISHAHHQELN